MTKLELSISWLCLGDEPADAVFDSRGSPLVITEHYLEFGGQLPATQIISQVNKSVGDSLIVSYEAFNKNALT